jgi:hypothetical protein
MFVKTSLYCTPISRGCNLRYIWYTIGIVATNESQSSDAFSGIPKVTPDMIRAFKSLPESLEDQFNELRRDNPELAREVFIDAHNSSGADMDKKRAFASGALFMYGLIKFDKQYRLLESLFNEPTIVDDGDEVQQP